MARTADKTDIPNRLTKAGRELFSRHGFNATGIQQITQAINDLARSGRENASGAGNLERAASDIRSLAEQLKQISSGYRL